MGFCFQLVHRKVKDIISLTTSTSHINYKTIIKKKIKPLWEQRDLSELIPESDEPAVGERNPLLLSSLMQQQEEEEPGTHRVWIRRQPKF